jgi:hypothetical protein
MEALLLAIAIALSPIYASESGGVQYYHAIMALFIIIRLVRMKWTPNRLETLLIFLALVVTFRESFAAIVEGAPASFDREGKIFRPLIQIPYIVFSAAIVVAVSRIPLSSPSFSLALKYGLILAVAVAVGGIMVYGVVWTIQSGQLYRAVGTFNNPNQLGYFAVCITSIASLLYLRRMISRATFLALVGVAGALVIASSSRAAIIAFGPAMIIGVGALLNRDRLSPAVLVLSLSFSALVALLFMGGAFDDFQFMRRLEGTGKRTTDSLEERGVILPFDQHPFGLLFGLGEYKSVRLLGREVHNTFWSFMIKFGAIGFILFVGVWLLWIRRVYSESGLLGVVLIIIPPTVYGTTHNGSRFSLLWVLIGLSFNSSVSRPVRQRSSPGLGQRKAATGVSHVPGLASASPESVRM